MIYFEVLIPVVGSDHYRIMSKGVWVEGRDIFINLGTINFDMTRIWGNLPVTFNGSPSSVSSDRSWFFSSPEIFIKQSDGLLIGRFPIMPDGKWIMDIKPQDSEIPIIFTVEAVENGGFFRKDLNPNHVITVHNTDKEIIFPNYPRVDFDAFTLSGTVAMPVSLGAWVPLEIYFYDAGSRIAGYRNSHFFGREDGLYKWSVMVPAFSFPRELTFDIEVFYRQAGNNYFRQHQNNRRY